MARDPTSAACKCWVTSLATDDFGKSHAHVLITSQSGTIAGDGFTKVTAGACGDLPGWRHSGVPPAGNAPLIAWSCLNSRLASAAPPVPLHEVGLEASSSSHQAWCRLTRTRPRRSIPPARRVSTTWVRCSSDATCLSPPMYPTAWPGVGCHLPVQWKPCPDDLAGLTMRPHEGMSHVSPWALASGCHAALTCRTGESHHDHLGHDAPWWNGDAVRYPARVVRPRRSGVRTWPTGGSRGPVSLVGCHAAG
jgi:hypothetical protein